MNAVLRRWAPDATAGLAVLLLGPAETTVNWRYSGGPATATFVVILATAVAVALSRRAPGLALTAVWFSVLLEVLGTVLAGFQAPVMVVPAADLAVLYGTARWGVAVVVWLGSLSVPLGGAVVAVFLAGSVAGAVAPIAGVQWLLTLGYQVGGHPQVSAAVIGLLLLAVPWLLGLVVRVRASAATEAAAAAAEIAEAEAAREQSSELARLRAEQARLARDVHDAVVLDAERAEIAYRVLQEMLTNAIRHGRRDSAIVVRREWSDTALVIEVRNGVAADAAAPVTPGRGLTGMAERLRAVDGRLAFVRRGEVFATSATIPEVRR